MSMKKKHTRRRYSPQVKLEAVRLVREGQRPSDVAKNLGIYVPRSSLGDSGGSAGRSASPRGLSGQWEPDAPGRGDPQAQARARAGDAGARLPKKSGSVLRERNAGVKYACIDRHRGAYPVQVMCSALEVTRSGYYAWRTREPSARAAQDMRLSVEIGAAFQQHRQCYGSPRIHQALQERGFRTSRKRVERLMRVAQLRARAKLVEKVSRWWGLQLNLVSLG